MTSGGGMLPMMSFGIGSWTYPWSIGIPGMAASAEPLTGLGLLEKAQELGVGLVQFADNLPLHHLSWAQLSEIRDKARAHDLRIEVGTRGVDPDLLLRYLEIARYMGSPIVRTLTAKPGQKPVLSDVERSLRTVLPEFAEAGVSIALENYEAHRACELAALLGGIGSPWLGICLDTVNSMGALEGPEHVVSTLVQYVLNLHIKDFVVVRAPSMMGFSIEGRPAGRGCLAVEWLFDQLAAAGRFPTVILELWTPFQSTVNETVRLEQLWAEESVRYLKTVKWLTATVE